ncbi:hypothetical protein CY34DRAFT_289992 [Suillus luteus UH-Slu-Lm8-n1]|uniref:Uncharacterized protein n=1 Tax=Suillus luteus UH-Slu-Lm8-n1 TaxID=930992 RepID=A0A0D0AEA8_9AGAM|nr:hypothetical protein CY34DRAFT_289992 [Suillus luteus UH-Slu-Lm8-n1]
MAGIQKSSTAISSCRHERYTNVILNFTIWILRTTGHRHLQVHTDNARTFEEPKGTTCKTSLTETFPAVPAQFGPS